LDPFSKERTVRNSRYERSVILEIKTECESGKIATSATARGRRRGEKLSWGEYGGGGAAERRVDRASTAACPFSCRNGEQDVAFAWLFLDSPTASECVD
jgi:hypothetical protein